MVKAASFYSLNGKYLATDALGWPLEDFAVNAWQGGYAAVNVAPGVYTVSFTGPATTAVSLYGAGNSVLRQTGYTAATSTSTYSVTVPAGTVTLGFKFRNTQGWVKNLKILQPGYSLSNYPVYTNAYVSFLKGLNPYDVRFKDFTETDNSLISNWSDRAIPADVTYASKGAPWEDVILLCNELHTNAWINIPYHATDDYVWQLANLFMHTLDPSLNIYIEFSNEVWNTALEAGQSNLRSALSEVQAGIKSGHHSDLNYDNQPVNVWQTAITGEVVTWADRRAARRTLQISNLFKSAWTYAGQPNPINTRVRVILGGQGAVLARFTNMLKYVNAVYGQPKQFYYGIGIAPYFGLLGYQDQLQADGSWTTPNAHITEWQAVSSMWAFVNAYAQAKTFQTALGYGSPWGLHLEAYEGGVETRGPFNLGAKVASQMDPQMEGIMAEYVQDWYSQGGDVMNWFRLGAQIPASVSGAYGITDSINSLYEPKEIEYRRLRG